VEQGRIDSARVHHAAFVAARDCNVDEETLAAIHNRARQCSGFSEVELDFTRDWALYHAEFLKDFEEAKSLMSSTIRHRDTDDYQVPVDQLAQAKILLLENPQGEAWHRLSTLRLLPPDRGNFLLLDDINWWYFVATLLRGEYKLARRLASESIKSNTDRKDTRYHAWYLTIIPWIGPRLARQIVQRKLGL
jgi:hypothetical protein